ncbi:histidine phosphatase family protein [Sphingomonas sp. KC8]|uniref:histidine phosphatase family protein n=1 Tax=Sphingomonas sp. KC8 TaxID=1030157 RepID=UPI000A31C1AC|nr:histidine phosphatase family protein [Sphingomonas sp. KC8]ARS28428.1 phosphoglycerate mutase [Sphingomonas sp. KC8]
MGRTGGETGNRIFIARHGETVFNAARRIQGGHIHTPLTRAGFAQADAMGAALAAYLGDGPRPALWASDTGRALQTLAIIAEHLGQDWHQARTDARLGEIDMGAWGGRYYADIAAEGGPIFDRGSGLFVRQAPGGEWYGDIARRLRGWLDDTAQECGDRLAIMHGISGRVLRGLLTDIPVHPDHGAPLGDGLPQGSISMIVDGRETVIHTGDGHHTADRQGPA